MSVVVKGLSIPNDCRECPLSLYGGRFCRVTTMDVLKKAPIIKPDWCPLVELPAKHGDLIDVKELEKAVLKWMPPDPCGIEEREYPFETDICASLMMEIEEQPTILEAEGD